MIQRSEKSYGVAVALVAVFGVLGVHHFYLGRYGYGFLDLALSFGGLYFILTGDSIAGVLVGVALLVIDVVHSIYVFFKLLAGEFQDGEGRLVLYPGQKITRLSEDQSI